jgi:rubrerythrin
MDNATQLRVGAFFIDNAVECVASAETAEDRATALQQVENRAAVLAQAARQIRKIRTECPCCGPTCWCVGLVNPTPEMCPCCGVTCWCNDR